MNPTHSMAVWLASLLPQDPPEWVLGTTIIIGIIIPLFAACLAAALAEWAYRKWRQL